MTAATAASFEAKQTALVSGSNIKTLGGASLLGSGDLAAGIAYTKHTSNLTAVNRQGVIADTSGGAFTVTLPASPTVGDQVHIADGANWSTNNLTVGRNGQTIEGSASNLVLSVSGAQVTFIFDGVTWHTYVQATYNSSAVLTAATIGVSVQAYDVDTAKTDVAQIFTATQRTNETIDNDGSFDLSAALDFRCTPTAGFTLTFTNIPATPVVQKGTVVLINPSAYAVAAHANTKVSGSLLSTISAAGTYQLAYRTSNGVVYVTGSGALA
jgi:hypothetical protein